MGICHQRCRITFSHWVPLSSHLAEPKFQNVARPLFSPYIYYVWRPKMREKNATNAAKSPFLSRSLCPLTAFKVWGSWVTIMIIIMNGVIITLMILIITMIMMATMATIKMAIMTMAMMTTYDDHQVHPDQASRRRSWAPTWLPPWRRQWLTLAPVTKTHTGVFCQYMHVLIQC